MTETNQQNNSSKSILFITTANLCIKPRLVKEIQLARLQDWKVTLIAFKFDNQTDSIHDQLVEELGVESIKLDLTRQSGTLFIRFTLINKTAKFFWLFFRKNLKLASFASNKRSILLYRYLKTNPEFMDYDIVNGRNSAVLHPIFSSPFFSESKTVFDVEDYHPGELIRKGARQERHRRELLMSHYLPISTAVTFASQLIANRTIKLTGPLTNTAVILNSFHSGEFRHLKDSDHATLKFIWFSQTINYGRGLEIFLKTLHQNESWHLTLIGNADPEFRSFIEMEYSSMVTILPVMSQDALHKELSRHQIGLALEQSNVDENRELCLTNKIFAYAQAGLFILATDTAAQKLFIEEDPYRGMVCGQTMQEMAGAVNDLIARKDEILSGARVRFNNAKSLAWEHEAKKLTALWDTLSL